MEMALDFLKDHFRHGLCYPVWIEDDANEYATRNFGKSKSSTAIDLDNSLLSSETAKCETSRCQATTGHNDTRTTRCSSPIMESRDACSENVLLSSLRDGDENNYNDDLDDVIAKIVRKRDELLKAKAAADEEIKRLRLENENLKNLNSISKRITKSQRNELFDSKKEIRELRSALESLQTRTNDAKNALDGSNFLSGISTCDGGQGPVDSIRSNVPETSGVLDSLFGWTIGEKA